MKDQSAIYVVDDDDAVRESLEELLTSVDLPVRVFASGEAFLEAFLPNDIRCVLLDVRMPNLSGLDVLERLNVIGMTVPVIMITGHGDVPMAVKAMKAGAFDFIEKPFTIDALMDSVQRALSEHQAMVEKHRTKAEALERLSRLTPREHDVLLHVVQGQPNKVIAYELGISQRTVEVHRARVMEKADTRSLPDLVRLALEAEITQDDS